MISLAAYVCVFEAVCVFVRMFIRICVRVGHYMCGACNEPIAVFVLWLKDSVVVIVLEMFELYN